jgi:CopG family nickel-responsive transcriptional regulator
MKKERLCRFSISMPAALANQLDALVVAKGYANRSQAVADLVRGRLVEHHHELGDREIAGTITLVYDHHKPHLQAALTDIQHDHHNIIVSATHVHLDHHNCLEVLIVRGKGTVVRAIADELLAAKGVKHGRLTITTTGREFET